MVIAVTVELLMVIVAIATGATLVGLVAAAAMAACMWSVALAEVLAFYRYGLPVAERTEVGRNRAQGHRPGQVH